MKKKILVIDDNNDIRENTAEILELAGYHTFTAENGKKGIELALKEAPDVIICDIMMPELDGYGVLHLLRKNPETQYIPLIFLTAKTERSDFRKGMEMGADDYITKPFEEIEILNAVETRLKKAQIISNNYSTSSSGFAEFLKDLENTGIIKGFSDRYETVKYAKKQTLYTEGKRPKYLYYLLSGKIKTSRTHEEGKEYITNFYSTSDFIGYQALLEELNYIDNATAIEESEVLQIPREDFLQMIYTDPAITAKFMHIISKNVKENEERLINLAYSSLRKRVANALVRITQKFNTNNDPQPLEISREELAQYIGTATESLIRTLSDFKSEKLVDIRNGKIVVSNTSSLEKMLY